VICVTFATTALVGAALAAGRADAEWYDCNFVSVGGPTDSYTPPPELKNYSFWEFPDENAVDYCETGISPEVQHDMLEFCSQQTQTGRCYLCFDAGTRGLGDRGFYSESDLTNVPDHPQLPTDSDTQIEVSSRYKCAQTLDQNCCPAQSQDVRVECRCPTGTSGAIDGTGYPPAPVPGRNGETVCNDECGSPEDYAECEAGFKICHRYKRCSDGAYEICAAQYCGFCGS
jgi:hypothetical protein